MDLTENKTQHPNSITLAENHFCQVAGKSHNQSIILPWNAAIEPIEIKNVDQLDATLFQKLCNYQPEIIILATGESINYPDPDLLVPLVKNNIGLEVMTNSAAARTYNVLLAENRQVLCVFLIHKA